MSFQGQRLESIVAEDVKVKVAGLACNVTDLDKVYIYFGLFYYLTKGNVLFQMNYLCSA